VNYKWNNLSVNNCWKNDLCHAQCRCPKRLAKKEICWVVENKFYWLQIVMMEVQTWLNKKSRMKTENQGLRQCENENILCFRLSVLRISNGKWRDHIAGHFRLLAVMKCQKANKQTHAHRSCLHGPTSLTRPPLFTLRISCQILHITTDSRKMLKVHAWTLTVDSNHLSHSARGLYSNVLCLPTSIGCEELLSGLLRWNIVRVWMHCWHLVD
jgi:hypothetical protein